MYRIKPKKNVWKYQWTYKKTEIRECLTIEIYRLRKVKKQELSKLLFYKQKTSNRKIDEIDVKFNEIIIHQKIVVSWTSI